MCYKIFIVGYYGYDIVGDDCVLDGIISKIKQKISDVEFIVSGYDKQKIEEFFPVTGVYWKDLEKILQYVKECDLIIVGGGGIFNEYDPWCHEGMLTKDADFNVYCASIPIIAKYAKKPCILLSIGVEPLYSNLAKKDVKLAGELSDLVCVRDNGSRKTLMDIGINPKNIHVFSDPCYLISTKSDNYLPERKNPDLLRIGVSLRNWDFNNNQNKWELEITKGLDLFAEKHHCEFWFLPFQQSPEHGIHADDIDILNRIKNNMKNSFKVKIDQTSYDFKKIRIQLSQCDMVVGMRFHSIVLSTLYGIPCIGIDYSLKTNSIINRSNLSKYSVSINTVTCNSLLFALESCLSKKQEIQTDLKHFSTSMKKISSYAIDKSLLVLKNKNSEFIKNTHEFVSDLIEKSLSNSKNEYELLINDKIQYLINDKNDFQTPKKIIEKLLKIDPDNPKNNYLYAFCLHQKNENLGLALKFYNKALELGFSEFWIRYNRGQLLYKMNQIKESYHDLKQSLILDPKHEDAKKIFDKFFNKNKND